MNTDDLDVDSLCYAGPIPPRPHTVEDVEHAATAAYKKAQQAAYASWSFASLSERGFADWRSGVSFTDRTAWETAATARLRELMREAGDPRADGPVDGPGWLSEPIRPTKTVNTAPHYGKPWGPCRVEWADEVPAHA